MKTRTRISLLVALAGVGGLSSWSAVELSSRSVKPFTYLFAKPPARPLDLTVRFMGAGTLSFDDGKTVIMEDGFFSRPGIFSILTTKIAPNEQRIDWALKRAGITRLAAIFVAHSHYDHVLDTGMVAMKTGATVLGTSSTANAVEGAGLPADRVRVIKDGSTFTFGAFKVTAFETPHSPHPTSVGFIDHLLRTPANEGDFKVGGNFSYLVEHGARRILVIASGNYVPGKFKGIKADVVFLGIGTFGKQTPRFAEQYWHEAVEQTGAKLVIPIHWDNFFSPLDKPFTALPNKMDSFKKSMDYLIPMARKDRVTLRLPVAFVPIDIDER